MTVYLIRHHGDRAVKIGFTDGDPQDRLRSMQTGSASVLELVTTIPDAPLQVEKQLHQQFAGLRVRPNGEWFHDDEKIALAFDGHRAANHRAHLDARVAEIGQLLATGVGVSTAQLSLLLDQFRELATRPTCGCVVPAVDQVDNAAAQAGIVAHFWGTFRAQFVWDLLPFPFLYDLYKSWFAEELPLDSAVSRQTFAKDLLQIIQDEDRWHCTGKAKTIRPALLMNDPEPLIVRYALKRWFNTVEKSSETPDPARLARPQLGTSYRGILRKTHAPTALALNTNNN